MSDKELLQVLATNRVSIRNRTSLMQGKIPEWVPTEQSIKNAKKAAEALYGPAGRRELEQREKVIRSFSKP